MQHFDEDPIVLGILLSHRKHEAVMNRASMTFCLVLVAAQWTCTPERSPSEMPPVPPHASLPLSAPSVQRADRRRELGEVEGKPILILDEECPLMDNLLEALEASPELQALVIQMPSGELPWQVQSEVPGTSPWMILFEDGKLRDAQMGAFSNRNPDGLDNNQKQIRHFLTRNGLLDGDPAAFLHPVSPESKGDDIWVFPTLEGRAMSSRDLRGRNLQGRLMRNAILSGSDLSGADLRGADLAGAMLFHTNFRGANLRGAILGNARWGNTTCPDGSVTNSECSPEQLVPVERRRH